MIKILRISKFWKCSSIRYSEPFAILDLTISEFCLHLPIFSFLFFPLSTYFLFSTIVFSKSFLICNVFFFFSANFLIFHLVVNYQIVKKIVAVKLPKWAKIPHQLYPWKLLLFWHFFPWVNYREEFSIKYKLQAREEIKKIDQLSNVSLILLSFNYFKFHLNVSRNVNVLFESTLNIFKLLFHAATKL